MFDLLYSSGIFTQFFVNYFGFFFQNIFGIAFLIFALYFLGFIFSILNHK